MYFFIPTERADDLQSAEELNLRQVCQRKCPGRRHDLKEIVDKGFPCFQAHIQKRLVHHFAEHDAAWVQRFRARKALAEHFPGEPVMSPDAKAVACDNFRVFSRGKQQADHGVLRNQGRQDASDVQSHG